MGLFHPDGRVREGVAEAIVERVGLARAIFETPRKDQQAWFITRYGSEVNLGNVPAMEVFAEALRLGLRADTISRSQEAAARAGRNLSNLVPRRYRGVSVADVDVPSAPRTCATTSSGARRIDAPSTSWLGTAARWRCCACARRPTGRCSRRSPTWRCRRARRVGRGARSPDRHRRPEPPARRRRHGSRCSLRRRMRSLRARELHLEPSPIPLRIVEVVPPEPAKLSIRWPACSISSKTSPSTRVRSTATPAAPWRSACRRTTTCSRVAGPSGSARRGRLHRRPPRADWARRMRTIAPDPRAFLRGRPDRRDARGSLSGPSTGRPSRSAACWRTGSSARARSSSSRGERARRGPGGLPHRACHGGAGVGARLTDSALYGHLWATDELREVFEERGRLGTWLEILAALAESQAELGDHPGRRGRGDPSGGRRRRAGPRACFGRDRADWTTLGLIRGSSGSCRPRLASGSTSAARCRT